MFLARKINSNDSSRLDKPNKIRKTIAKKTETEKEIGMEGREKERMEVKSFYIPVV